MTVNFSNEPTDPALKEVLELSSSNSTPVAVNVIERAKRYDMHPDQYDEMKDTLDPQAELQERIPAQVNPSLTKYSKKSSNHAKIVENETGVLDYIARQGSSIAYHLYGKRKDEEEVETLQGKKYRDGSLPPNEEEYLTNLLSERADKEKSFNLEGYEQIPGQVAGVLGDIAEAVSENTGLVQATTAAGMIAGLSTKNPLTLVGGTVAGLGLGITGAITFDAFKRVTHSTYDDLSRITDEKGEPLNLTREQNTSISTGLGMVQAGLEAVTGGGVTALTTKMFAKKGMIKLVKNTSFRTALTVLGQAAKSFAAGGSEEYVSEVADRVAKNYALGVPSEATLMNAIIKTKDDFMKDPKFRKQLTISGLVGGIAGGGITGITGAIGSRTIKKQFDVSNELIQKQRDQVRVVNDAVSVLQNQDKFTAMSKVVNETQLKKMSVDEMSDYKKTIFEDAGYKDRVWFSQDDITMIEGTNPELADKIKQLDMTESSANNTGSGAAIEVHKFSDLVDDFPTISDFARNNPEALNPLESRNVLNRLKEYNTRRQAIFESLGEGGKPSIEQLTELESLDKMMDDGVSNVDPQQIYLEETKVFTENIKEVIPEKRVESYEKAQREAREAADEQLNAEFDSREERIENRIVKANEKIIKVNEEKKLSGNIKVIENFKVEKNAPKIEGHSKKGYSSLAVDPKFLPDDVREAYTTEPNLKKRKLFVEGGITPEESAALAGVESFDVLIDIMANTPSQPELVAMRKIKAEEIRQQVKEVRGRTVEERRRKEVYDNLSKLRLEEMKYMRIKKWPATKQGIKTIALELPVLQKVRYDAKQTVDNTRVGDVKPKQYNVETKRLHKKALNHVTKNEVEQAFITKEQEIKNIELTRESLKARANIAEAKNSVEKITSKSNMKSLKKAGLLGPVEEILDLFDLTSEKPSNLYEDSYYQYLDTIHKDGRTTEVPASLIDYRQRGKDLTVSQYLNVTDRLKTLNRQAKMKNKLLRLQEKRIKRNKLDTIEAIVFDAVTDLQTHPQYDTKILKESRVESSKYLTEDTASTKEKVVNEGKIVQKKFGLVSAAQSNFKNIVTELDQENLRGTHAENLIDPMNKAELFERSKNFNVMEQFKKIGEDYNIENFRAAFNEVLHIPEFEGFQDLGNGKMLKIDLWRLFAYLGDPGAVKAIPNFVHLDGRAMDVDTITQVMDRVLTEKDAKLVQNFVNIYDSFKTESFDLHQKMTGTTPTLVQGVPFKHRGKMITGGYVHVDHNNVSPTERAARYVDSLGERGQSMFGDKQDNKLYSLLASAGMTEQGRNKDRTGSSKPLDVSFMGMLRSYEDIIHDLAYREAGSDTLTLLKNPAYSDAIRATVGEAKYKTLVSAVIETVGQTSAEDTLSPFSSEIKGWAGFQKGLMQNFAVANLGFKISSILMQPLSVFSAMTRMGLSNSKYIGKALQQTMSSISQGTYNNLFDQAAQINPDLLLGRDSIDDSLVASPNDVLPKTSTFSTIKNAKRKMVEASFIGLKKLDVHIKAMVTLASYSQFLDGNVKNFPQSRLDKMTPQQIHDQGKKYSKQIADLALTTSATIDKSALEKLPQLAVFTRFYTDVRAQLNTSYSQVRKIENAGKRAAQEFSDGNIGMAASHLKEGAFTAGSLLTMSVMMQMYIDLLRGEENPIKELSNVKNMNDFKKFIGNAAEYTALAPVKNIAGQTIFGRDIGFAMGGFRKAKTVSTPLNQMFGDFTTTLVALGDLYEGFPLTKQQKKAMTYSAGYVLGVPVRGPKEIGNFLNDSATVDKVGMFIKRQGARLSHNIAKFINENKDSKDPKIQKEIETAKDIQRKFVPALQQNMDTVIPEDSLEVLKLNEWDDQNPDTKAAGIYQFTPERWEEIMENNPDLGLTEDGRVSKDPMEQEKAMKWSNEENARGLTAYQVPVNNRSLYGAHRFGLDDYVAVTLSNANEKLTKVVEDMDLFKGFTTVKQVNKYVNDQVKNK